MMFCSNNLEKNWKQIWKQFGFFFRLPKVVAEPESDAPDDVETDIEGVISDYKKEIMVIHLSLLSKSRLESQIPNF